MSYRSYRIGKTADAVDAFRRRSEARARDIDGSRPILRGARADFTFIDEHHPQGEPVSASPETNDVIIAINKAIETKSEQVFQIAGPITTTVNIEGKGYRSRPLKGDDEILFRGARVGKKEEFVFEFEPLDAQEYNRIEFTESKAFTALRNFEPALVGMLLPEAPEGMSWRDANITYQAQIEAEKKLAEEAAAAARAGDQTHKNPNYGMFA